jgi:hypothetical protein
MYLFGKHVNDLGSEDISRLIDNEIRETQNLEYKRELNFDDEKDKKRQEFLADISSIYNAEGGCIIYGVEEKKDANKKNTGYPASLYNQAIDNFDVLSLKLHDIIKSGTQPAIVNVAFKMITIENVKVLVVGIAKGFGMPAMVTYNDINKFFRRNSSGKYAMNVYELNQAFMQNQSVVGDAQSLVKTRVNNVLSGQVYPNIDNKGALFIHTIPIDYQQRTMLELRKLKDPEIEDHILPIKSHFKYSKRFKSTETAFNYDGFMKYRTYGPDEKTFAYNQFFRNGIIEFYSNEYYAGKANSTASEDYIYGVQLISAIIEAIHKTRKIWTHLEVNPPFFVFITSRMPQANLAGLNNCRDGWLPRGSFDLPYVYFETFPETNGEVYTHIKKHLDIIWQTAGNDSCPDQDEFLNQLV